MNLFDKVKKMAMEEDESDIKPVNKTLPVPGPVSGPIATTAFPPMASTATAMAPADDSEAYNRVLAKTDLSSTPTGQVIKKYLDANVTLAVALQLACSVDHLTPEAILADFDSFQRSLTEEHSKFFTWANSYETAEITARRNRLEALQKEQAEVSSALSEAEAKLARARSQFTSAEQRRTSELNQQRQQYSVLLQGK